ncbi:MAG: GNAT family N-acetyltransferase [Crenarchaeota archaeon]|nr:GNAT family N-acetyltransferase [Thermoproteota archaeon]
MKPVEGKVTRVDVPRTGYRWKGSVEVEVEGNRVVLVMSGSVAQWLQPGENVRLMLFSEPQLVRGEYIALPDDYRLERLWRGEAVEVWPPWRAEERLPRRDPLRGEVVYEYRVVAREATSEQDYIDIVNLEQYHYASKEEIVAVWRCPICGRFIESNVQPTCPEHGVPARLQEIRGSLPSSRFLVLELVDRKPYEPRIVAYVRVDTPIPLMHRRITVDGKTVIEKMIREKVFPKDWFHPTYWPLALSRRREIIAKYRELAKLYGSRRIARAIVGEEIAKEALRIANTAAARIARVVVHPDYRGDGLGVLAVKMAIRWIAERRVPEMKRRKHIVETIAQMARYNPFFEKAGFVYMWETASGRPVLMYPLTDEARSYIERFLQNDPEARKHGGKLYKSRYGKVDPIESPIRLVELSKVYSNELDISRLPTALQEVLKAFGVEKRIVERYVLRNVNIEINPREVVVVVGASGAGKTTLLRMIIGACLGIDSERYKPSSGRIEVPRNAKLEYFLPGEREPQFGEEPILQRIAEVTKDPAVAVEVLNAVGLSDAVFYRARFEELSTGQKERAKLALLLASKPNLLIIDEFAAHLDALTAQRVARKLSSIARSAGITVIVSTNRPEVIRALGPDKIVFVGYGTAYAVRYEESALA